MKRKMVRVLSAALIGAMALGLAACGSGKGDSGNAGNAGSAASEGTASADKGYTSGIVVKTNGNPNFREMAYGAVEAGKDLGCKIIPMACESDGDIAGQTQKIEDLLSKGCDAIIASPQDSEGIATAVEECAAKGIPFVAIDTMVAGDAAKDTACYLGIDNIAAGKAVGTALAEKMGGKGNVVIIEGVAGASSSIERTEGFKQAFAEYPDIKIVGDQNADFDQSKAQQKMADILQSTKDIDGVVCCNDLMALGCITSLEEAGLKPGEDVIVAGYDISSPGLTAIQEGKMYCAGYQWGKYYGYWGVEMAIQAIEGSPMPDKIPTPSSIVYNSADAAAQNGMDVEKIKPFADMLAEYDFGW